MPDICERQGLMSEEMSKKQELFVSEYLVDLNATQAAIRAGYSRSDARNAGYRNLRQPQVKAAIDKAQAPRLAKLALDADAVLAELTRIARANLLDYMRFDENGIPIVDPSQLDRESAAALSEVVVEEFLAAKPGRRRCGGCASACTTSSRLSTSSPAISASCASGSARKIRTSPRPSRNTTHGRWRAP